MHTADTTLRSFMESLVMIRPARCEAWGSDGAAARERSAQMAVAIRVTAITCRAFLIIRTFRANSNPLPWYSGGGSGWGHLLFYSLLLNSLAQRSRLNIGHRYHSVKRSKNQVGEKLVIGGSESVSCRYNAVAVGI
jgi:hypothetical protein